jgi:hypothetical protein
LLVTLVGVTVDVGEVDVGIRVLPIVDTADVTDTTLVDVRVIIVWLVVCVVSVLDVAGELPFPDNHAKNTLSAHMFTRVGCVFIVVVPVASVVELLDISAVTGCDFVRRAAPRVVVNVVVARVVLAEAVNVTRIAMIANTSKQVVPLFRSNPSIIPDRVKTPQSRQTRWLVAILKLRT